jgi:hypothetical protein
MRLPMKVHVLVPLLTLVSFAYSQEKPNIRIVGTAINTTNPDQPIAAPIEIVVDRGECTLRVSLPLIGSGDCIIKSYDQKTKRIEILSEGTPPISWSGTIKGNFASGTYNIAVGNQTGSFYCAVLKEPPKEAAIPKHHELVVPRGSCSPAVESAITGEVNGWDGETIFKLDNGQIWQQAEYDYTYFYEYHPDVTIYETSGGCRMKVEDESDTVLVKHIK